MAGVRICAVGDNLLHDMVLNACAVPGGYNFDNVYAPVAPLLRDAALAAVAQVTVFPPNAADYSGFPLFGTPPAAGDALVAAGFTAVASATNHMLDKGPGALRYTINYWRENHPGTLLLGVHAARAEAGGPAVVELDGIRAALFNYTSMLNFHHRPPFAHHLVDLLKPRYRNRICRHLRRARENADIVIIFVRWGDEYHYVPSDTQREWAALFAACGVDVVIGQGTHVLQPLEVQKRPDGGEMTVFYSLGNFFSGQREIPRLLGGMAELTLVKDGGAARVAQSRIVPLVTHVEEGFTGYRVYPLAAYTGELAARHYIAKLRNASAAPDVLLQLAEDIQAGRLQNPEAVPMWKIFFAYHKAIRKARRAGHGGN